MTAPHGHFGRSGPGRWAAAVTAVTVPGILIFFLPIVADARLGDGEPAAWLETGARAWLACTAAVALLAVVCGYWIPRAGPRLVTSNELPELGLLLTVWGTLGFLSIWTMLALDGDPRWLVWFTLAAALFGITSQVHQLCGVSAGARRVSRERERAQRRKRSRR
jgi:hypothetical protein